MRISKKYGIIDENEENSKLIKTKMANQRPIDI